MISKSARQYLFDIIKDFRFDKCDRFDLEFDYDEFFSQTLDKIFEDDEQ